MSIGASAYARQVNPRIGVMKASATRGEGLDGWYAWLRQQAGIASTPASGSRLVVDAL